LIQDEDAGKKQWVKFGNAVQKQPKTPPLLDPNERGQSWGKGGGGGAEPEGKVPLKGQEKSVLGNRKMENFTKMGGIKDGGGITNCERKKRKNQNGRAKKRKHAMGKLFETAYSHRTHIKKRRGGVQNPVTRSVPPGLGFCSSWNSGVE